MRLVSKTFPEKPRVKFSGKTAQKFAYEAPNICSVFCQGLSKVFRKGFSKVISTLAKILRMVFGNLSRLKMMYADFFGKLC